MDNIKFENNQSTFNEFYRNRNNCEHETLDYKLIFKFDDIRDKLELTKDIVSFANTYGGVIIFGVSDKTYEWEGLDDRSDDIDDIKIKSFIEKYVSKPIGFRCGTYKIGSNTFYMITIDKNKEVCQFIKSGEYTRNKKGSKKPEQCHVFKEGDLYGRVGSSCKDVSNDLFFLEKRETPLLTNLFDNEPPYKKYVERKQLEEELLNSLGNNNIRHIRVNGLGGIGKTSFVRNLCEKIFNGNIKLPFKIDALIWITGKMDFFNPDGQILSIRNTNLTYREMLEIFSNVFMIDSSNLKDEELYALINKKMTEYPSVVVFDNMETIKDERIHAFYKNVPINCHVIFTSRTDLTAYYTRIDIDGFDNAQFNEYIKNSIEEFRPDKFNEIYDMVVPSVEELRALTGGSPILINFIMCKICAGNSINQIIQKLKELENKKKDINGFYNSVMAFCFDDSFESTGILEKKVLFAMSIPTDENSAFDLSDLSYILERDEYEIGEALKNIYSISFCSKKNEQYMCPLLIRAFVDKKISEAYSEIINKEHIAKKYYEWYSQKRDFESKNENYYDKVKAYDFKRKLAASKISQLKNSLFEINSPEDAISKFDDIISEMPSYGMPYFEKAKYLNSLDDYSIEEIDELYRKAIECDSTNDFFISEYAFFLSKRKKKSEALYYFRAALKLNPNMPNIYHGLATCMVALFDFTNGSAKEAEEILANFEKGYVNNPENIYEKFKYCGNAHAHAKFLFGLQRYNESLAICDMGLKILPSDKKLLALKGNIMAKIDPEWVSDTKIRKNKKGIFSSIDDNVMKEIIKIIDGENAQN